MDKKDYAGSKQEEVDKGPGVKKKNSHVMRNKEKDIWKEMDVPVMGQMMRRSRDSRDRAYINIARIMSTVPGAVEEKAYR